MYCTEKSPAKQFYECILIQTINHYNDYLQSLCHNVLKCKMTLLQTGYFSLIHTIYKVIALLFSDRNNCIMSEDNLVTHVAIALRLIVPHSTSHVYVALLCDDYTILTFDLALVPMWEIICFSKLFKKKIISFIVACAFIRI